MVFMVDPLPRNVISFRRLLTVDSLVVEVLDITIHVYYHHKNRPHLNAMLRQ